MIIDFEDVIHLGTPDRDLDAAIAHEDLVVPHLTKEKWVVAHEAMGPSIDAGSLSISHFDSEILKRMKLQDKIEDMWIAPVSSLVGPCYVMYDKYYSSGEHDVNIAHDDTGYVDEPRSK